MLAVAALAPRSLAALPGRPFARENALVREVYARHPGPLWIADGRLTAQAEALIGQLRGANRYGLDPGDFAVESIGAAVDALAGERPASAARLAALDRMLTRTALRLVGELHYGRVDPRAAGFEMPPRLHRLDPAATVEALATAPNIASVLGAIQPPFYHYRILLRALAKYRALAAEHGLTRLPAPAHRSLRLGDVYAGAPALRRRLSAVGDLAAGGNLAAGGDAATPPNADVLDEALVAALMRFQQRHGLTPDGILGPRTYAALTTPMAQRVEQIELTLERWRWLPPFAAPPIIVNIPQFRLFAFPTVADRAAGMLQMPVIVGEAYPRTQTPVFTGKVEYLVFRPYWDLPRSIVRREVLPALATHPNYLAHNHLELVRGPSESSPVVAATLAAIAALAAGRLRLRQRPGVDNALGLVKFIFPNSHEVYLHSTPARALFEESRRAFSHGCIRVGDPVALARYVLRNNAGQWTDAKILAAMHGADDVRVTLAQPVPVMILYGTALATEAGPVDFFDDIYGQDRRLAALLRRGLLPPRQAQR
ncbi:MAG TPA: L,D-transpeptidase family protein [Steroidobacteraceae bacterium]|nr:L,D-transpeptidase family protein [Steroidobacteraceae bacterium]